MKPIIGIVPLVDKQRNSLWMLPAYDGYCYLKIFSVHSSKEEMIKRLRMRTDIEKVVTFGSIKGKYDVYIGDGGGNSTIKKLKKIYQHDIYL